MGNHRLTLKRLGIDTRYEHIIFMHKECPVCKAEGFAALSRVLVKKGDRSITATINSLEAGFLDTHEAALSESAWEELEAKEGETIAVRHLPTIESLSKVRAKLFGHPLSRQDYEAIIRDIKCGAYSNVQIAAFVSACVAVPMNVAEVVHLTRAMIEVGNRIHWNRPVVVDKHCVGGLPGNRTTPILVSIVAAAGLTIPKTSSRAITSPSGTADCMETLTCVAMSMEQMRQVVEKEGGCLAWGGSMNLSPVDDMVIRVEKALDVDSESQMIASVLSKKAAAGSTHVILDIPIGPTAKVRSEAAGLLLKEKMIAVGKEIGLEVRAILSDGRQPVGRGIGPALEARDVLAVLNQSPDAPKDLEGKALQLAGALLEMGQRCPPGDGEPLAASLLRSGKAKAKFEAICEAQGGMRTPPQAPYTHEVIAEASGTVDSIDNRRLAQVAKLAGAPMDAAAGLECLVKLGQRVTQGAPLYRIHSQAPGELDYVLHYVHSHPHIIGLTHD